MATKEEKNMELRFYRWCSIFLLSSLLATSGYIATRAEKNVDAAVTATQEIPALRHQLEVLNANFAKMEELPLQVRENTIEIRAIKANNETQDKRLVWLEDKSYQRQSN